MGVLALSARRHHLARILYSILKHWDIYEHKRKKTGGIIMHDKLLAGNAPMTIRIRIGVAQF